MRPRVVRVDPDRIDPDIIRQASGIIHNRGLVAFPTETVYGLGANALDAKAAAGIFEAKKRPLDDPLIIHIADKKDVHVFCEGVTLDAEKLMDRFWPGPLTLVLKKKDVVPDLVTTGLDTVAIRMPSNPVARELIKVSKVPIAAPSANLFGRPSPTTARHVLDDLNGAIDMILDGGKTEIGVESTVVEVIGGKIIVLRPGGTDMEALRETAGEVELSSDTGLAQNSPGKYPQHYSPRARVMLVDDSPVQTEEVLRTVAEVSAGGKNVGILAKQEHEGSYRMFATKILGPQNDTRTCASRLFHLLREFDDDEVDIIVAEAIGEKGLGLAVMNRLKKAAGPDMDVSYDPERSERNF